MTRCSRCKQDKPAPAFHRKGAGRQGWCRECHNAYQRATRKRRETPERRRAANLKTRYRLSPSDVAELLAKQGGVCAICLKTPRRPVVDHDHTTRAVRGVLCHGCNIALPHIENEKFRSAALAYLEASR